LLCFIYCNIIFISLSVLLDTSTPEAVEQLFNHKVVSLSVAPSGFKCLMNYIILVQRT